ncbi:pah3 homeobox protein encoded by the pah3 protein [Cladorrhinum sp. PSN332]|nr:pah3 homeobox protein encoded by the pah3 protein [Cladorrhinum sp. PSN332]
MDSMDYMDPYRRPYPAMNMPGYAPQQHQQHLPHPQGHQQYPYWASQHLVAFYQQQQRAAMLGPGNMHLAKNQTEPKPRLAKDEVELLEREFNKNPKPNSSTKRELAEQMGVEVPRINNWFQNRRAKEKQMKKTAEFEAQQAMERAASESKSSDDQEQGAVSEFYGLSNQHQPLTLSTAAIGVNGGDGANSNGAGSGKQSTNEPSPEMMSAPRSLDTPTSPDSDDLVSIKHEHSDSPVHHIQNAPDLAPPPAITSLFDSQQHQPDYQQPTPFSFRQPNPQVLDGLVSSHFEPLPTQARLSIDESGSLHSFAARDYFAPPSVPRFPSEMIAENMANLAENELLSRQPSHEDLIKSEGVSPTSMPESPSTVSELRFKSPPPPADIAGRRKLRRPTPLGLTSLRGAPGPKTGVEAPRRADTASPMRRISSATGPLCGRVQKSFMGPGGPRSPFAMDRNKEALLHSIQGSQSPIMASLNNAMSPMSPGAMSGQSMRETTVGTNGSDDDQGFTYGSLGAMSSLPMYKADPTIKTPPGTPGLQMGFHDAAYFSNPVDNAWNYAPQDEPLPTPSLCSHGGSELEFSMAPQMPGYVASQPATPSFPPSIGPTYNNGFFGSSMAHAEYHFPDSSYPSESSARSSPVGPPRSKHFQFAQNVTPQDFNSDKA